MIYFYTLFAVWMVWCVFSASRIQISRHQAEILEHTRLSNGHDVVTWRLTYWRAVHGELLTHREASRNAKSSRAIPVWKTLAQVWSAPFGPLNWGTNKPGMQAGAELIGIRAAVARTLWVLAGRTACVFAWIMMKMGGHKQWVNRVLEPWQAMVSVFTFSTMDGGNFWELRAHLDAQPEFQYLAFDMKAMYDFSLIGYKGGVFLPPQVWSNEFRIATIPGMRRASGPMWTTEAWHLPMVTEFERDYHTVLECIQMSTARCARASFDNFDGSAVTWAKDSGLYKKLVGSKPWHASPTEHQATNNPVMDVINGDPVFRFPRLQGNLRGCIQFRKVLEADAFHMLEEPVMTSVDPHMESVSNAGE